MTEGILTDLAITTLDLHTLEADAQFDTLIRSLRDLQQAIDDVAEVAAQRISNLRGAYDFRFNKWRPFLEEYTRAHLKRKTDPETGETTEIKNYRSIGAGGGGFFRAKPSSITYSSELTDQIRCTVGLEDWCEENLLERTFYEVRDEQKLVELCENFGLKDRLTIIEGNPYGNFAVGAKRAWTPAAAQKRIAQALKGEVKEEEEDQE